MEPDNENNGMAQKDYNKPECRACLQIFDLEEDLVHLFQAWVVPWDGMGPTIADDLAKIANIQVLESDKHSKLICNTCCQKLREACMFTVTVQNNNILLKQRYSEEVTEADKEWPKPIQLDQNVNGLIYENNINIEVKQEVLSDEECEVNGIGEEYADIEIKIEPEEFIQQKHILITAVNGAVHNDSEEDVTPALTNGNIDLHEYSLDTTVKEEPVSEDELTEPLLDLPLECMLCTKSFNSVSGLKSHVIAQHSYKTVKRKTDGNPSPKKVNNVHTCSTCRRTFATSTDLLVHETCHNQYTCYGCGAKFDSFQLLADHRLQCMQSNGTAGKHKSLKDVKRRLKSKEDDEELRCKICNQQFSDAFYMNIHMEVHQPSGTESGIEPTPKETKPTAMEIEALEDIFTDTT